MAKALCAREAKSAAAHLELARMHRAKRLQSEPVEPSQVEPGIMIFRADKEA